MKIEDAEAKSDEFYFWRVAIGHYSEIMGFLGRMRDRPAIASFIDSSPSIVRDMYTAALDAWQNSRRAAKHIRNEAIFHYPDPKGIRAMRRALRTPELQAANGGVTSQTGKVRDARMHFADEVMARMVMNACGETEEAVNATYAMLDEGVAAFMRFANHVQDEFFLRQSNAIVRARSAS